jgi:hypothetical protein
MRLQKSAERGRAAWIGGGTGPVFITAVTAAMVIAACSHERPPPPPRSADASEKRKVAEVAPIVENAEPYRAKLGFHAAALYLPTWFAPRNGGYDLIVHFHGVGTLQETNLEHARVNAAVVTVNLGVSTDLYANAFRDPASFEKLIAETDEEVGKSGRASRAKASRIALSAWSAGFASIAKIMSDRTNAERIDAVVVADGFFTSLSNTKPRAVNGPSIERFAVLAEAATKDDKLFVITHSSIPTSTYASTGETAAKLLEMTSSTKTPSKQVGPGKMRETYAVDRGSFHVKGYEGVLAGDHIKQITAMGETTYPYLRTRWEGTPATVVAPATGSQRAAP